MEDGEIQDSATACSSIKPPAGVYDYDPSYEWPGGFSSATTFDESSPSSDSAPSSNHKRKVKGNQPSFRLIAVRTSILSSKQRLAIVDGYSEVQFGRDIAPVGSTTPRIRLKEMQVSKLHATAYWDTKQKEWAIVDMGSMHGTFLQSGSAVADGPGMRLSPSRAASIPRRLRHLDRLTIGNSTFLVHMHDDQIPCEECSSTGADEIPLFPIQKESEQVAEKRSRDIAGLDVDPVQSSYTPPSQRDPKKALTMLKQSLLTRHDVGSRSLSPGESAARYVDRSARRRALHPVSHPDAPGISSIQRGDSLSSLADVSAEDLVPQPPPAISASNIGHRLLVKQGWESGTALGVLDDQTEGRCALVEPLQVSATMYRAGLGIKRSSTPSPAFHSATNWKESAKWKRWDRLGYDRSGVGS